MLQAEIGPCRKSFRVRTQTRRFFQRECLRNVGNPDHKLPLTNSYCTLTSQTETIQQKALRRWSPKSLKKNRKRLTEMALKISFLWLSPRPQPLRYPMSGKDIFLPGN